MVTIRHTLPAALLLTVLTLTGCTGGGNDAEKKADAGDRLDRAASALADATALDITLTTSDLPNGQQGLLSAEGVGDHSPAFQGTVEVVAAGATIGADVIATDGSVWAKTGFSPTYVTLDPASIGAPDPAALVGASSDEGLGGLLARTTGAKEGDQSRDGSLVLTTITGAIDGGDVAALLPTADADTDFDVTWRLTDDDVLHDAKVTGPFYGTEAGDVTYTLTIDPLDEPVSIEAP